MKKVCINSADIEDNDQFEDLEDLLFHVLGESLLLDNVERYFGTDAMMQCYESIARDYDIIP